MPCACILLSHEVGNQCNDTVAGCSAGGWFAQNPAVLSQVGKVLLDSSTAKPVTFKRWLVATDACKCADEAVSKGIHEVDAGPCPSWLQTCTQLSSIQGLGEPLLFLGACGEGSI